jgi:hypothetical protein
LENPVIHRDIPEDEKIYSRPIALYFGGPCTIRQQEILDKRAIKWDCSYEFVLNDDFADTINSYSNARADSDKNYFDYCLLIHSGISEPYSLKVWTDSYIHNGSRYPRLIFKDGFIRDKNRVKRFFLRDEVIDLIGQTLEEHTEYEYIEFKRLKNV